MVLLEARATELWEMKRESKMQVSFLIESWSRQKYGCWKWVNEKRLCFIYKKKKKVSGSMKKKKRRTLSQTLNKHSDSENVLVPCGRWCGCDFPEWPKAVCRVPGWAGVNNQKTKNKKKTKIFIPPNIMRRQLAGAMSASAPGKGTAGGGGTWLQTRLPGSGEEVRSAVFHKAQTRLGQVTAEFV